MALEGIRVLELTQHQQGPAAGMMLADLGAEVIKIEQPVGGDPMRGADRSNLYADVRGRNFPFETTNRNKKGITLNLKTEDGQQIAHKLVGKCDIFLHNLLDGVIRKLGMDYETLSTHNPMLVYVDVSGYGPKGPDASRRSFDYTGQARSGIMTAVGEPGLDPQRINGGVADQGGAVMGAYGALAGLVARQLHGVGQRVDTSMLGFLLWIQNMSLAMKLLVGHELPRYRRTQMWSPLWNHYLCGDGKWLVIACNPADRFWPGACRALGLEEDPRFTDADYRHLNGPELIAVMDKLFLTKPRSEWMGLLNEHDVTCIEVSDFDDVVADPQIRANGYITDFDHPTWGQVSVPGLPIGLEKTPGRVRMPAPNLGQHTEEVLTALLGYDRGRLLDLRRRGII